MNLLQGMALLTSAIPWWPLIWLLPLGAAIGSFINCLADRIPRHANLHQPPSFCDSCGHTLSWSELIPLFSWLLQKGRCKQCHASIPARNFWLEIATTLLPLGWFFLFGATVWLLAASLFSWILVGIILVKRPHVP